MPTLADALALDRDDPLRALREAFVVSDDDVIYADGNSLGRLSRAAQAAIERTLRDEWADGLVASWRDWIDLPIRVGDRIATGVLGATEGTTVVADSTTVNFYKLVAGALAAQSPRHVVVTDAGNFPTNRFVLQGLPVRLVVVTSDPSPQTVDAALRIHPGEVAVVTLSQVSYQTGARVDLGAITRVAHDHGALALWDLSHSAGAIDIELASHDVDLAVGCTYKYLNGGPGSPAFLYVHERLHGIVPNPIQGWFGAADQFAMGEIYEPAPGVRRYLSGTPSILGLRAVEAGVETLAEAGIPAIAAKGALLTAFLIDCIDAHLAGAGFDVVTPRLAEDRGAHVSVRHEDAWKVCQALAAHARAVTDFREPDILRIGLAPAYASYVDAYEIVLRIRRLIDEGLHVTMPDARSRVT